MNAMQAQRSGVRRVGIVVVLLLSLAPGCVDRQRPEIDQHALVRRIRAFEGELADKSDAQKAAALAGLADDMLHRRIRVRPATVVAVYERGEDWDTKPFFGFDYVEAHYLRLLDLDPEEGARTNDFDVFSPDGGRVDGWRRRKGSDFWVLASFAALGGCSRLLERRRAFLLSAQ